MGLGLDGMRVLVADAVSDVGGAVAMRLSSLGCRLHLAGGNLQRLKALAAETGKAEEIEIHHHDLGQRQELAILALYCDEVDAIVACSPPLPPETGGKSLGNGWNASVFAAADLARELRTIMMERESPGTILIIGPQGYDQSALAAAGAALMSLPAAFDHPRVRTLGIDPGRSRPESIADVVALLLNPMAEAIRGSVVRLK